MLHDQHVLTNGMYLPFCFFLWVWRISNYYFQLLRCRNLALNRVFPLFLRGRYVSHLGRCLYTPIYLYAPYIWTPPETPKCSNTPHMSPMLPCASVCSRMYLYMIGACGGPSLCLDTPMCLDASPYVKHLAHMCMLPYMSVCSQGYLHVLWGTHAICWGSGGHQHICQAFGVCQDIHWMSCTFLVVHNVSSLYFHSYDYYSFSDCGVFWYVICIISDHGSSLLVLPTMLG